jgi:hypothetical protein
MNGKGLPEGSPFCVHGAVEWTRTTDLLITNQLLYQLSYYSPGICRALARRIPYVNADFTSARLFWPGSHKRVRPFIAPVPIGRAAVAKSRRISAPPSKCSPVRKLPDLRPANSSSTLQEQIISNSHNRWNIGTENCPLVS